MKAWPARGSDGSKLTRSSPAQATGVAVGGGVGVSLGRGVLVEVGVLLGVGDAVSVGNGGAGDGSTRVSAGRVITGTVSSSAGLTLKGG